LNRDKGMTKRKYPLAKVYGLIEPGPVVLLTTAGKARANVMTLSWLTMVEFEPPLVACVLSDRDYSYELLKKNEQCAINIPTLELAQKMVSVGNHSGRNLDKFKAYGLTATPASIVNAPLVAECYASLECQVYDTQMVAKYGLFILEVVKAWVDTSVKDPKTLHHRGKGKFMVAGETIKLSSKMK
jgi:flavin reductase (DIM6/NTAB) family NADH-FMN oxidoreductase RutF